MNRRQMMTAFPAVAAAAAAVAHVMPAEAQAVTHQTPKGPPAYKGRLRPGAIALSYRPPLKAKESEQRIDRRIRVPGNGLSNSAAAYRPIAAPVCSACHRAATLRTA